MIEPTLRPAANLLAPSTRFLAVLIGISRMSSWSWPIMFWPLRSSTPMIVSGTLLTRTTWSTGLVSPNRFCATVCPIRATLPAPLISACSKPRPSITAQSRTWRYSGEVP